MTAPRSLQAQLAIQLVLLYVIGAGIAVGCITLQGRATATDIAGRDLSQQAQVIAEHVERDPSGRVTLVLPQETAAAYAGSAGARAYAVRLADGTSVTASDPGFGEWAFRTVPPANDEPVFFRLTRAGPVGRDLAGLTVRLDSRAGPVVVAVAGPPGADEFVHAVLQEFVFDIAWILPAVLGVTLVIALLAVRRGLRPVREASELAQRIEPSSLSVRLPEGNLPSEVEPLATAVNHALDRLQRGFEMQRAFTANAAHELRTPLAIVTAALDEMHGNGNLAKLRADVGRMNRLIDQLLRVARLDALALDTSRLVDLRAAAERAVAALAPWAIARRRALALTGAVGPVWVHGDAGAIEDAIRNLVENAVQHAPADSEIVVDVDRNAVLRVADRGPGVPPADRQQVFDRFWRGRAAPATGAGLGLSIVRTIMDAHGGSAEATDNPGGGALFVLRFPLLELGAVSGTRVLPGLSG